MPKRFTRAVPWTCLEIAAGTKAIQRNSQCHVQIGKEADQPPGSASRSVSLRGSKEAIERAKQEINRILDERAQMQNQRMISEAAASIKMKIPNAQVGLVIGRQGITIKSIQERNGVNVQIPQVPDEDDVLSRTITINGSAPQGCEAAKTEIEGVIADRLAQLSGQPGPGEAHRADQRPPHLLVIANEYSGAIIGKGGHTIRSIQVQGSYRG